MKKILVVYHSNTGNTMKVAKKISQILKADIDEIVSKKKIPSVIDIFFKKVTKIKWIKNPFDYDLVIIGTPIWARAPTPAIRTYLKENKNKMKKVAFFCTYGGNFGKTFVEMEKMSKKPLATLALKFRRFEKKEIDLAYLNKIKEFCEELK